MSALARLVSLMSLAATIALPALALPSFAWACPDHEVSAALPVTMATTEEDAAALERNRVKLPAIRKARAPVIHDRVDLTIATPERSTDDLPTGAVRRR